MDTCRDKTSAPLSFRNKSLLETDSDFFTQGWLLRLLFMLVSLYRCEVSSLCPSVMSSTTHAPSECGRETLDCWNVCCISGKPAVLSPAGASAQKHRRPLQLSELFKQRETNRHRACSSSSLSAQWNPLSTSSCVTRWSYACACQSQRSTLLWYLSGGRKNDALNRIRSCPEIWQNDHWWSLKHFCHGKYGLH